MGFLANKRILITGMISTRSIAYGVAQAMHREGAELAFTYQGERVRERVLGLAEQFDSKLVFQCDVANDDDINQLFVDLNQHWDGFDGFVHAIAFAPREALEGEFLDGFSREAFRIAHDISSYSFPAMAKAALPMMEGRRAAILTLSYLGAVRTMPHYNVMGMAKASLEAWRCS
jgi:enoyl-[acyl-carrier protein] reductase I